MAMLGRMLPIIRCYPESIRGEPALLRWARGPFKQIPRQSSTIIQTSNWLVTTPKPSPGSRKSTQQPMTVAGGHCRARVRGRELMAGARIWVAPRRCLCRLHRIWRWPSICQRDPPWTNRSRLGVLRRISGTIHPRRIIVFPGDL